MDFSNLQKMQLRGWLYRQRRGDKKGENEFKFSQKRAPPRIQGLEGNKIHSWKEPSERILADQVQKVQGAGRPPPLVGRPGGKRVNHNYWSAYPERWPPMCAQHNYVVETQKK